MNEFPSVIVGKLARLGSRACIARRRGKGEIGGETVGETVDLIQLLT